MRSTWAKRSSNFRESGCRIKDVFENILSDVQIEAFVGDPGNTSFFPKILKAIAQGTINVGPVPVDGSNRIGCAISSEHANVVAYPRPLARDFAITPNQVSSAKESPWL
jgi:hypothetical protein